MNPENYLYLSALLFTIGAAGVLIRRNAIIVFMCIELMLNAVESGVRDLRPDARQPRRSGLRVLHDGGRGRRGRGRSGDHHDHLPFPPFGFRRRRQPPRTDGSPMTHILEKVTLPDDDAPIGGAA